MLTDRYAVAVIHHAARKQPIQIATPASMMLDFTSMTRMLLEIKGTAAMLAAIAVFGCAMTLQIVGLLVGLVIELVVGGFLSNASARCASLAFRVGSSFTC